LSALIICHSDGSALEGTRMDLATAVFVTVCNAHCRVDKMSLPSLADCRVLSNFEPGKNIHRGEPVSAKIVRFRYNREIPQFPWWYR
jgi:hypothetical protein